MTSDYPGVPSAAGRTSTEISAHRVVRPVYPPSFHPRPCEDPTPRAEDERGGEVFGCYVCERRVREVYFDQVGGIAGLDACATPACTQ